MTGDPLLGVTRIPIKGVRDISNRSDMIVHDISNSFCSRYKQQFLFTICRPFLRAVSPTVLSTIQGARGKNCNVLRRLGIIGNRARLAYVRISINNVKFHLSQRGSVYGGY